MILEKSSSFLCAALEATDPVSSVVAGDSSTFLPRKEWLSPSGVGTNKEVEEASTGGNAPVAKLDSEVIATTLGE